MLTPTLVFQRALQHRRFPWLFMLLGAGLLTACHYALAYDLYHRLPTNESVGFALGHLLGKLAEVFWVGAILMVIAGYDSDPFRTMAHTMRVPTIVFAVFLPFAIVFMPSLNFPDATDVPNSLEVQAAIIELQNKPIFQVLRGLTALTFGAQLWWAFHGLQLSGAFRRNASIAVLVAAGVYAFAWIIGML